MFADGVVDLVNNGSVTNAKKTIHKGRIVGSFLIGTKKVFSKQETLDLHYSFAF